MYCRLSKDDEQSGESTSIGTQRAILEDYCKQHDLSRFKFYIDDGYSGLNFHRPGFQSLLNDIEKGFINMVITKDLSRLGRDYIMTGYYSEIFFQEKGVRYIAVGDNFDSDCSDNEIAPFKNILNEMYARDISKKVKAAKHQQAKRGLFIGSQAPFGYQRDPNNKHRLIVDPEAADSVRTIFSLAEMGLGNISIAAELRRRQIMTPAALKVRSGDTRYSEYPSVIGNDPYAWAHTTVGQIVKDPVYTGVLTSLKTEVINCKTKKYIQVSAERQITTPNAHEAIISSELFDKIQEIRRQHPCPAHFRRFNLFRGKLFCECCGHPLTISRKHLKDRVADIYLCMYHCDHPDVCPQTHRIYHDMLYPYVLQQIKNFAKSMQRRKINSPIKKYSEITELTPEILDDVIERIEIGHLTKKSRPSGVIAIYWKMK